MASDGYSTYHCLCTNLLLATLGEVTEFPKRKGDNSFICQMSEFQNGGPQRFHTVLVGAEVESEAMVVKLEDGFEKRFPLRCRRCGLMTGYQLDKAQYEETKAHPGRRDDVVYLLPGGLQTTAEMSMGRDIQA